MADSAFQQCSQLKSRRKENSLTPQAEPGMGAQDPVSGWSSKALFWARSVMTVTAMTEDAAFNTVIESSNDHTYSSTVQL